ncbi:MAG: DUF493 domain-containing protein [Reichenbachiella sp.]
MNQEESSFKEKLEKQYVFPALYTFKFIVPKDKVEAVENLFPRHEVILKPSSGGKYISTTIKVMVSSSSEIIDTYKKAKAIDGIISL